jgi:hypothetical protein
VRECVTSDLLLTNVLLAVGDSRSIVCRKGKSIPTSSDHSLQRIDERDRILKTKGRLITGTKGQRRVIPCPDQVSRQEVIDKKLALAMSRSLGHKILSQYGGMSGVACCSHQAARWMRIANLTFDLLCVCMCVCVC